MLKILQINLALITDAYNYIYQSKQMASIELITSSNKLNSQVRLHTQENLQDPLKVATPLQKHEEQHIQVGQLLKSFIYGGLDGTMNILTIIVSSVSSGQSNHIIMVVGVATIIGDAIGMGLGDYISFQAEQAFIASERQRESYQIDNMREEEISEINQLFKERQYSVEDAQQLSRLFSQNKQTFLNVMMLHELGLVVNDLASWKVGLTTFIAFIICGTLPLIPYIVVNGINSEQNMIIPSLMIGLAEFFMLAIVKARVTDLKGLVLLKAMLQIAIFGSIIVAISYGIGFIFQ